MPKKRGNGEGSVYKRKDGLWVGQYKIQTQNGTKTKYIYSKTRKEAASKLADALAERDSGLVYKCGPMSLGDYLVVVGGYEGYYQGAYLDKGGDRCESAYRSRLGQVQAR